MEKWVLKLTATRLNLFEIEVKINRHTEMANLQLHCIEFIARSIVKEKGI